MNASEEVPYRADWDGVLVALGLDDNFPAEDGPVIKGHAVDATIARCLGLAGLQSHLGEEVREQGFELAGLVDQRTSWVCRVPVLPAVRVAAQLASSLSPSAGGVSGSAV